MNLFWRESKGARPVFGVLQKYFLLALSRAGLRVERRAARGASTCRRTGGGIGQRGTHGSEPAKDNPAQKEPGYQVVDALPLTMQIIESRGNSRINFAEALQYPKRKNAPPVHPGRDASWRLVIGVGCGTVR